MLEETLIHTTLQACAGHKLNTAKRLGYGRNTLSRKIQELRLS